MSFLQTLGKGLSFAGEVQDFLPNQLLKALHLPQYSGPFKMGGDFLQDPKKFQFGREWGDNVKLGALATGVYFGAPLIAHAFGIGGAGGNAAAATSEGLPSGTSMAMGDLGNITPGMQAGTDTTSLYARAPASGTTGGGTVGPNGGNVGTGGGPAQTKAMNPILKSFMENYMKNKMQPQPGQQFTPPPMPGRMPGRQYLPTLGGY